MQSQQFRDEIISPMATGRYGCTHFEEYRNLPTMEWNGELNHSERQVHKKRPRTPPLPPMPPITPIPRRSRHRSRSSRRRYSSPASHHETFRSRDQHIDSMHDHSRSSMNSRARPHESRCIGIFGLSDRTNEADIRRIFSKYGYIENIILVIDGRTRRSRGYCFIYFQSIKSAIRAVESSNNLRIDNRFVRVDFSITSRPRSPGSYERHKDDVRHHDGLRHRSQRRHSPSPRRYYR